MNKLPTSAIPPAYGWQSLLGLRGDELESHYRHILYRHILAALGTGSGLTPVIVNRLIPGFAPSTSPSSAGQLL